MPANQAAWLPSAKARPLQVKEAPYTPPAAHEIVVKNHALAINPVDWGKHTLGNLLLGFIKYPFILGSDVAGEVVEVGSAVSRFHVGDRVIGQAVAFSPKSNRACEGAFQHYTVLREHLASPIPGEMAYADAAVLPLALATAGYGLFHPEFLGLRLPSVPAPAITEESPAVVITGGASSVGTAAVQLAASAGYRVYSTASPKNHEYVKALGAAAVFDYRSKTLVEDIVAALKGKKVAGAYAIGNGSIETCMAVLGRSDCTKKFVAYASPPTPDTLPTGALGTARMIGSAVWWMASTGVKSAVKGIRTRFIDGDDWVNPDGEVGHVFSKFLPQALATGQLKPLPEAQVVGTGLESLQEAMDIQQKGVSARKIVVTL